MYHRDVIAYIARRLPHQTRRDVAEVLDVLSEVWASELVKGESVTIPDLGQLSIEVQDMKAGGAMQSYGRLRRLYGRFRLTPELKRRIEEANHE